MCFLAHFPCRGLYKFQAFFCFFISIKLIRMSSHKLHSFSWENRPGIPDEQTCKSSASLDRLNTPLPLPPCRLQNRVKRRIRREEDPFLAAYLKCTNTTSGLKEGKTSGFAIAGRFSFSCKNASGFILEDVIVRLAQVPAVHHYRGSSSEGKGSKGSLSTK